MTNKTVESHVAAGPESSDSITPDRRTVVKGVATAGLAAGVALPTYLRGFETSAYAQTSAPVKMGFIEDESGNLSVYGIQKLHAAQLAVAEINDGKTLKGSPDIGAGFLGAQATAAKNPPVISKDGTSLAPSRCPVVCLAQSMGATGMPIEAYLPTSGASFGPEAMNMGKALEGAVDVLGIGPSDETKREAVARFIIKLAEIDGGVDAASLRDKVVMALGGSIHLASLSKDGTPDELGPVFS